MPANQSHHDMQTYDSQYLIPTSKQTQLLAMRDHLSPNPSAFSIAKVIFSTTNQSTNIIGHDLAYLSISPYFCILV